MIRANPEILRPMLKTFEWVVNRTIMPASLLVLISGIAMVLEDGDHFEDIFVTIGIIGAVATIVVGAGVLSPRMRKQDAIWHRHFV